MAAMIRTSLVSRLRVANPIEDPVAGVVVGRLQYTQKFRLHRWVALADFVEKERPAVGLFERPDHGPRTAPVNAPFLWPKSSDSSSSLEMAAQLIATNGLSRRGLASWIALANISLPVPLSPRISTETSRRAARRARPTATRMLRLLPAIFSKPWTSWGLWLDRAGAWHRRPARLGARNPPPGRRGSR